MVQRDAQMPSDRKIKVELGGTALLMLVLIVVNLALIHVQLIQIRDVLKQIVPAATEQEKKQ